MSDYIEYEQTDEHIEEQIPEPVVEKNNADKLKDIQTDENSHINIPRLNKKIILFVIIIFIGCILAGFIFSSFSQKRSRNTIVEKQTNVAIPEFDHQITAVNYKQADKKTDPVIPAEEQNPYLQEVKSTAANERYLRNADYPKSDTPVYRNTATTERSAQDARIQRLLAEEEAARRSEMTIAVSFPGSAQTITEPPGASAANRSANYASPDYAAFPVNANQDAGAATNSYSDYRSANMQEDRGAFYAKDKTATNVLFAEEPAVSLSNLITAGTIIPAVLLTAVNSDLPGDVLAMVTQNVYSFDGRNVLIPQGTKLLANYNSNISWYQQRIQIAWNRLIRPDGKSVRLGNMPGVDAKGSSGAPGAVDDHPWQLAKGLGILAAFSILSSEIEFQAAQLNAPGLVNLTEATGDELKNVGAKYVDRALDIQPTISVKAGKSIFIFINIDLALPVFEL